MTSKRSVKDSQQAVSLDDFGHDALRRRAALGPSFVIPRNSGQNRTASKKALLKAITAAGGKW
jgi:hypothetical protein